MNYLQNKKLAFMSIVNRVKGFIKTVIGSLPLTLTNCVDEDSVVDYKLYGNSIQNGTPTPNTPIEVESVGEYDEATGKYKIPITVSDGTRNITTNIYLDEPLHKIGDYADYIDFENGKVLRYVKKKRLTKAGTLYTIGGLVGFYTGFDFLDGNYMRTTGLSNREKTFTEVLKDSTTIWLGVNNSIVYWIGILSKLGFTTLAQMNSWLSENETWIYWVSKTPTETPITLPNLPTFKGTSIISIETTIQPSKAEIEYYSTEKE